MNETDQLQAHDTLDQIIEASFELSRNIRQQMHCLSREEDSQVNFLQLHALFLISQQEGMTMKEVAIALKVTSPSATAFIDRLVKLGWVERIRDPQNRKLVRLKLTPAGADVLAKKMDQKKQGMKQLLGMLSHVEQIQLRDILYHLIKGMSSSWSK